MVTGGRADYGLLKWVLKGIESSPVLQLQLVVTGMHLSDKFGRTVDEIEADGFTVTKRVEMLLASDTSVAVSKSMSLGIAGFADAFEDLDPDVVVVLGDRFEIFAATAAAMIARLPITHIHGGEVTEGAIDEAIRHSITKMAHLHFVAAESYRKRVIQLGEHPDNVVVVGGLGVDGIANLEKLSIENLEESLGFRFLDRNLLITFHPVTLSKKSSFDQMSELLEALEQFPDVGLIFTMPNADPDSEVLFDMIRSFCSRRDNAVCHTSLGQQRYLSSMNYVDAVVGNSSSGLLEAPSLGKPTVNIGQRQTGRLKAPSVIDCENNAAEIELAIRQVWDVDFLNSLSDLMSPYGCAGASELVVSSLETFDFRSVMQKRFFDL